MMRFFTFVAIGLLALGLTLASVGSAQTAPVEQKPAPRTPLPPAPAALLTPAIMGPLRGIPFATCNAGPFGKLAVNGIVNEFGMWQGNRVPSNEPTQAALSNRQVFIQKTDDRVQFYLKVCAYTIPPLATPFLVNDKTLINFYGPCWLPKAGGGKNICVLVGSFPTLICAEYAFAFESMNIQRGLRKLGKRSPLCSVSF